MLKNENPAGGQAEPGFEKTNNCSHSTNSGAGSQQKFDFDPEAILQHIKTIFHHPVNGVGVISSYGENPITGEKLSPKICHFDPANPETAISFIKRTSADPHRNIYLSPVTFEAKLLPNNRGNAGQIIFVHAPVADFDDDDADQWAARCPVAPSYVLETSPGRYQAFFIFDEPVLPERAQSIAKRLKAYCQCDHGTADIDHIWRMPGLLNWPNKKKAKEGRPLEPVLVKIAQEFTHYIKVDDLDKALPEPEPEKKKADAHPQNKGVFVWDGILDHLPLKKETIDLIRNGAADRSAALMTVLNGLVYAGLDDGQIESVIRQSPLWEKVDEKGNSQDKWLARDIAKARAFVTDRAKGKTSDSETPDPEKAKKAAETILQSSEPCPVFDTRYLPGILKNYIEEIAKTTESAKIIITMSVYAALSGIIGKRVYMGEYFTKLYVNLYIIMISGSGMFKTTGMEKAAAIVYKKAADIRERVDWLKADQSAIPGTDKKAEKERKDLELEIRRLEAQSPLMPNKCSPQGIIEMLALGNGGVMYQSELGEWLESMKASFNNEAKAMYTDIYDVPEVRQYKTKGDGLLTLERPYLSICGVSALKWLTDNVCKDDVSSGFMARFMIFLSIGSAKMPPALPIHAMQPDNRLKSEILKRLDRIRDDHPMTLSDDAKTLFEAVHQGLYSELAKESESTKDILMPFVKRWSPYILKLAMINQIIIDADADVSVEAITGAVSIIEQAIASTKHLYQNQLGESDHQKKCRLVREWLARHGGKVKRQEILISKVLGGGVKDYDYILETLTGQGLMGVNTAHLKNEWEYFLKS